MDGHDVAVYYGANRYGTHMDCFGGPGADLNPWCADAESEMCGSLVQCGAGDVGLHVVSGVNHDRLGVVSDHL